MFDGFKRPEPRILATVPDADQRQARVDSLKADVNAFARIVADQHLDGGVDDRDAADYLAARERWEVAVRDLRDARTGAIAANTIALLRQVHPTHLRSV